MISPWSSGTAVPILFLEVPEQLDEDRVIALRHLEGAAARGKDVHDLAVEEELVLPLFQEAEADLAPGQALDGEGHLRLVIEEAADDGAAVDGEDGFALLAQDGRRVRDVDLVMPALDEDPGQPALGVGLEHS